MKKTIIMFVAFAIIFLTSVDLHSAGEKNRGNGRIIEYCALQWHGFCDYAISGDACYLVDENCKYLEWPDIPEEDNE